VKLYEATEALRIVEDLIEEHADAIAAAGGDIAAVPAIAELLAFAEDKLNAKVERVALKIRELEAAAEIVKQEKDRLAARQKAREHAAKGLKAYLQRELERAGVKKVEGELVTVALQDNPPSVQLPVNVEVNLEELYTAGAVGIEHVPESFTINRKAILDAVKAAEAEGKDASTVLPAGWSVVRGRSLRIR
jgi:hypothetical protein